ncbi:hypothetical protein VaNZ11_004672, partial [Volvox africanus]
AHAKIAELEARGISANTMTSATSRAPVVRPRSKASGVIIPAFRSVEEVRAHWGVKLLPMVNLALDLIFLPSTSSLEHRGKVGNGVHADRVHLADGSSSYESSNANSSAQDPRAPVAELPFESIADAEAAVAAMIGNLPVLSCARRVGPTVPANAKAGTVPLAQMAHHLPSFPSEDRAVDNGEGQARGANAPQASKSVGSAFSSCDEPSETSCKNDLVPASPGTSPETAPSSRDLTISQSVSDSGQQGSAGSGGGAGASGIPAQQMSPPSPRTPQQAVSLSAVSAGPWQPSVAKSAAAQPPPGFTKKLSPQHVLSLIRERSSGAAGAQRQGSDPSDQRRSGVAHLDSNSAGDKQGVGINDVCYPPGHPYPFAITYQTIDPVWWGCDLKFVNYVRFQKELVLLQQLRQQELYQQQRRHLYNYQLRIQQRVQAQQRRQSPLPNQSRPTATPALPPTSTMHLPAEPLHPPQGPRPCPSFEPDLKDIEAVLVCELTSLFRKEPELFRNVYGFDLDWWIDARGRPLGDAGVPFHNFAAVVVRMDRCAAPAWAGHPQLLNPTVSALLNDKVFGNALILKFLKLDRPAGVNAVLGGKGALYVLPLTPPQLHAYVQESDNVTWQVNCYKNLAPGLVESLATDERATWLSQLPLVPLDEQGNPDLREAVAMIKNAFRIQKPAALTRLHSYSEVMQQRPGGCGYAGAVTSLECQRGGPDAAGGEELGVGIPKEVAPLLRALRCTSPWCTRICGRKPATQHNRTRSCPLGHFWRDLDLSEGSRTPRLVFDAARLCGSRPLQPELCPALVDRLPQMNWSVALPDKGDAIQDLGLQITRNGSSVARLTPNTA